MEQAIDDDGIPFLSGIELRQTALLHEILTFLKGGVQSETQAQQPVSGRVAPSCKDLMEIDLTHAGLLGQNGLGYPLFYHQIVQNLLYRPINKAILIIRQETVKIAFRHQFLFQITGIFPLHFIPLRLYKHCKITYNFHYYKHYLREKQYAGCILFREVFRIFDYFLTALERDYTQVQLLKQSERGQITLLRHKQTGARIICRRFHGCADVYRSLLQIDCPHLPRILEVAEKDGQVIVLEEYIQGDTLAFLLECGPLSPTRARCITRHLCAALWVLHCLGAVHRDVKPENVILRGDQAVLIDFDASRLFKPENSEDTQVLGTTGYAAPEQYGLSQTDGRADIYALGILLNVLLTGRHPSQRPAAGRLGRIVQRCTMTNPQKRYQNVKALMEVL